MERFYKNSFVILIMLTLIACKNQPVWEYTMKFNNDQKKFNNDGTYNNNYPLIYDDFIIVAIDDPRSNGNSNDIDRIMVLNKETGKTVWTTQEGSSRLYIVDGDMYTLHKRGDISNQANTGLTDSIKTFDVATGEKKREYRLTPDGETKEYINNFFMINDRILVFSSIGHDRYCSGIDRVGGNVLWKVKTDYKMPSNYTLANHFSKRSNSFYYYDPRYLHQLDPAKGETKTMINIQDYYTDHDYIDDIVVNDDQIIIEVLNTDTMQSRYIAFDLDTYAVNWKTENSLQINTGIKINPLIFNDYLYIITDHDIRALSLTNASDVWLFEKKEGQVSCLPLQIISDMVYWPVLSTNEIYIIDPKSGTLVKKMKINNPIDAPFIYEDGVIYYISNNTLYTENS